MLEFYLGGGGTDNLGKYLGGISLDTILWLQKNELIINGQTGCMPEGSPESLPYYDDVILSAEQVYRMYNKCKSRLSELQKTSGFNSSEANEFLAILTIAVDAKSGLSTLCD